MKDIIAGIVLLVLLTLIGIETIKAVTTDPLRGRAAQGWRG